MGRSRKQKQRPTRLFSKKQTTLIHAWEHSRSPCYICPALFSSSWASYLLPIHTHSFLMHLCFGSWGCKREKLAVMPCVCARVRADGHMAQSWLDLLPAKGQNWLQRIWQQVKAEQGDPTCFLQPTTVLFLLGSVKTGTWEDSVSKCCAIFRLRVKVWITVSKPWAQSNSMLAWLNSVSCPQHPNYFCAEVVLILDLV